MRSRKEIEAEIKFFDDIEDILPKLNVELLLDIRELLQGLQPPTIMATTEVESDGGDEGLRSKNHIHP